MKQAWPWIDNCRSCVVTLLCLLFYIFNFFYVNKRIKKAAHLNSLWSREFMNVFLKHRAQTQAICWQRTPIIPPHFLKRFYLFIFRQRRREGGREGDKQQCVVAFHMLHTGDLAHTQACALTGNPTRKSSICRLALNH